MSNSIKSIKALNPYNKQDTMAQITLTKDYVNMPLADLDESGDYTLTMYVKADATRYLRVNMINNPQDYEDPESLLQNIEVTNTWQKVSFTFNAPLQNLTIALTFMHGTYYIYHAKLEKGNKATDYSKAESDDTEYLEKKIIEMNSSFTVALDNISAIVEKTIQRTSNTEKSIEKHESAIKQNSDNITSEVKRAKESEKNINNNITKTKEELSSSINQTANSITNEVKRATESETKINNNLANTKEELSTKINQTAESIEQKVSKNDYNGQEIISLINQTAESVKILAKYIDLLGAVSFSSLDNRLQNIIDITENWTDSDDVTLINGGMIKTKSIKSLQIDVENLFAQEIEATGKIVGAEFNTGNGTFQVDSDGKLTTKNISILGGSLSVTVDSASKDIISIKFTNSAGNVFETKITPIGITTYKDGIQNATLNGMFGTVNAKIVQRDGNNVVVTGDNGIQSFQNKSTYLEINTSSGQKGINWWNSDTRLKKNIEDTDIDNALEIVDNFKHHKFDWKDESIKSVKLGYLAHELQKLDEDLVFAVKQNEDSEYDELLQIDETHLIPYLSKAIQELYSIVKEQQKEINNLKELICKQ